MNTHVAVYTKKKQIFEEIKKAAEGTPFILHENPEFPKFKLDSFIIVDAESFQESNALFTGVLPQNLYVLSAESDEANMKLVEQYKLHHLVGFNENIYAPEVIRNMKKAFDKKIWGLSHYFGKEAEVKTLSLSDSKHTGEMIEDALKHFDFKDYFSSPIEYIQVMANELISNSLYKGPNKRRHEQGLDSVNRRDPVFLKGSDLVQVTLGMDKSGVALSVQDSFGGLTYDILIQSLKRSFDEKTPMEKKDGAGLGLYLTFLHSNQFIINFRANFRTEVICIIEKNKRYKNYKQRIRSFHFFQEVASEKINN